MEPQPILSSTTHQDGLTAAERFEAFHDAGQPLFDSEPLRDRAAEDARCEGWLVDDLIVCRTSFTWTRFERSPRLAGNGGAFLIEIGKGEQRGEVDGHPLRIGDDVIVLRDLSRPFSAVGYADELIGVMIPRYHIENRDWLERQAPVVKFPVATPGGQILLNALQSFVTLLPDLTQNTAKGVTAGLVGLLNGLLETEKRTAEQRATPHADGACLEAMKTFLFRNLHDPELSAAALIESFHCSRSKVYRLFAEEGGVGAFIRKQRLVRCREDLSRAEKKSGRVQEVAERWGFHDPYHFSSLFKRSFGVAPSGVLGSRLAFREGGSEGGEERGTQIHHWMLSIFESGGKLI